jgi:integrase
VAREGAPAAAKPIVASIRFHHIKLLGRAPSYDQTVIQQLTKGIANTALLNAAARPRRVALSPSDVSAILQALPRIVRDRYEVRLYRAAFLLAFGGFLRVSEYTAASTISEGDRCLKLSELELTASAVTITLSRSKTSIAPVSVTVQASIGPLCPVAALNSYLELRGDTAGPLFRFTDGRLLSARAVNSIMKRAALCVGLDPATISSHCFRIGAATSAAAAGVPSSIVQAFGRWASGSFFGYVRPDAQTLEAVSSSLNP